MRRTRFASFALAALIGGALVGGAGPANAVSDATTCGAVGELLTEMNTKMDEIAKNPNPSAATLTQIKDHFRSSAARLGKLAADADPGTVKNTLNNGVEQMNRVASSSDADLNTVLSGSAFQDAMAGIDTVCGT
ncbi:hypothetical protein [Nocardia sp. NPDC052566]|uniref:hypothetical protein n=1 Tax=Nocardia sp. NPDC052566 TaxID=3364330 RepID=UPI0037C76F6B